VPRDSPSGADLTRLLVSSRNAYKAGESYTGTAARFVPRRILIRPRLFLADDHPEFLKLEMAFLNPHFELIGTAADGVSLVRQVLLLRPDLVVVDIIMPILNGIDAVRELVQAGSTAKFIFLTIHSSEDHVQACLKEGARGFVSKSQMSSHLIPAIKAVLDGLPYIALSNPVSHG